MVVRGAATVGESAVLFYGADVGSGTWVTPNSVVMKNESLGSKAVYGGCPVQSLDVAPAPMTQSLVFPNNATVSLSKAKTRYVNLDLARGLAVLGMIFMHFVSAESGETGISGIASNLAIIFEGKAAVLFCILAGMTWELQAVHAQSSNSARSGWNLIFRAIVLAALGVAFHILVWPTEILVPLALMMLVALAVQRYGVQALLLTTFICLALTPLVLVYFGRYIESDWNADGSHLTDNAIGWATLRYLIFDGHYALIPWLAFPLIGMILMAKDRDGTRPIKVWFAPSVTIALLLYAYTIWSQSNNEVLGALAPYLTSTWLPTSLPFVISNGSCAVAIISGLSWVSPVVQRVNLPAPTRWLVLLGRTSLTHYLFHLCLVYVPLRTLLGHEEWSVTIGLWAFAGYVFLAVPLTERWLRRFHRGPVEAVWAILSGQISRV